MDILALLDQAARLLNQAYLPAATPASIAAGATVLLALPGILWAIAKLRGRRAGRDVTLQVIDDLGARLRNTELLLADMTSTAALLRQRIDQLALRQDSVSSGNSRSGLRQAIALSKHGATTRHLIDTCGLSQGEAHLIQSLYGSAATASPSEELH